MNLPPLTVAECDAWIYAARLAYIQAELDDDQDEADKQQAEMDRLFERRAHIPRPRPAS